MASGVDPPASYAARRIRRPRTASASQVAVQSLEKPEPPSGERDETRWPAQMRHAVPGPKPLLCRSGKKNAVAAGASASRLTTAADSQAGGGFFRHESTGTRASRSVWRVWRFVFRIVSFGSRSPTAATRTTLSSPGSTSSVKRGTASCGSPRLAENGAKRRATPSAQVRRPTGTSLLHRHVHRPLSLGRRDDGYQPTTEKWAGGSTDAAAC